MITDKGKKKNTHTHTHTAKPNGAKIKTAALTTNVGEN